MRLKLDDTTIYAKDFSIETSASEEMKISIGEGYAYIDTSLISKECDKADREKVLEMAKHILRIPYTERLKYFGTNRAFDILSMPVDQALDRYEVWKKENSAEELIKSLKPQDVIAVPDTYKKERKYVLMVTATDIQTRYLYIAGITKDGCLDQFSRHESGYEGLEKIGRVVETTDILGEIKKIEDEWRKSHE